MNARRAQRFTLAAIGGDCNAQHAFDRHRVRADAIVGERAAAAGPTAIMEEDGVGVIITTHGYGKVLKLDAVGFFGVMFGFGDFADQA
jgi:hypothetical protein